ncbi:hypothetical protein JW824_12795 [bacterium]|nr:hypothetical protein [bacterium]RQV93721.1 MAG: hypothetical protein EH221_08585 [bacterium]
MTKNKYMIFVGLILFVVSCHQGLAPLEMLYMNVDFPIPPEGGDPVGVWVPDTTKPVHVALLDPDQLPTIIDSLILDTELDKNGLFLFSSSGLCSIYAVLKIEPIVYLQSLVNPLVLSMNDTLIADGPYEIIDDKILTLSIMTTFSQLDTLGFTSRQNDLELISLPNSFPVEGFDDIQFYYVMYLTRSIDQVLTKNVLIPSDSKKDEDRS